MKQLRFSIIIPIYRGIKYVNTLLKMVKQNCQTINEEDSAGVELILVNDCPEEPLTIPATENLGFQIQVINSEINHGIHYSKQLGLQHARGEFLLFLDQDDIIDAHFLIDQWKKIKNADVCVCNGILQDDFGNRRKLIYPSMKEQSKAFQLENYMVGGNKIVSMGQALIRACAISRQWCEKQMKINGADDYLLWILMLHERKKFIGNPEVLYYHIQHNCNVSNNSSCLIQSQKEMLAILKEIPGLKGFSNLEEYVNHLEPRTNLERKQHEMLRLLNHWLAKKQRGQSIQDFFMEREISTIAIYGMGILGERLYEELRNSSVSVLYGIDRNARSCMEEITVLEPDGDLDEVDAVIVTVAGSFDEIRKVLAKKLSCKIIDLADVIYNN